MRIPLFSKALNTAVDPVCDMQVDTSKPPGGTAEHEGQTYYFCAPGCRSQFEKSPATFIHE